MKYLIVGGDSTIGKALYSTTRGYRTTRKYDGDGYFLDLENPSKVPLPKADVAIICAAMTNKTRCEESKDIAFRINCTNTLTLCNELQEKGTSIIYLSTDEVLGNSHYGYTKRCLEKALNHKKSTIVRLSKVISNKFPLLEEWYSKLKNSTAVYAYDNLYTAPIYVNYVVDGILKIAESKRKGIYQLSAKDKVNYYQIGKHMAKKLDVSENLVKPKFYSEADDFTLMSTRRFKYLTKENIPSSYDAIDLWIRNYETK